MIHLYAFMGSVLGFAALAAATVRTQEMLSGRPWAPGTARAMRALGAAMLAGVPALLVGWQGWGLGLVMACGHASLGAGLALCALVACERLRARA